MGAKKVKAIVFDEAGTKMRRPKDPEQVQGGRQRRSSRGCSKHAVTGAGPPGLRHQRPHERAERGGRLPDLQLQAGPVRRRVQDQRRGPGGARDRSAAGAPPTAATAAASSSAPASTTTRTATTSRSSPSTRRSGRTAATAASTTSTSSPSSTAWTTTSASTPSRWASPSASRWRRASSSSATPQGALRLLGEVGKGTPLGPRARLRRRHHRQGVRRRARPGGEEPGAARLRSRAPSRASASPTRRPPRARTTPPATRSPPTSSRSAAFVDPLKTEGQVELSRNLQIATAAIDSTGMCLFIAFAIMDQPETFQALLDLLELLLRPDAHRRRRRRARQEGPLRGARLQHGAPASPPRTTACPASSSRSRSRPHQVTFTVKDEELDQLFNWNSRRAGEGGACPAPQSAAASSPPGC